MRIIALLAVAAGMFALAESASATSLAPFGKFLAKPGTEPTLVCNKRRHRHGYTSEVYSSFVDEDDERPYVGGYYDEDDDADGYAFVPERRRVYRAWSWQPAPYDNGPWY